MSWGSTICEESHILQSSEIMVTNYGTYLATNQNSEVVDDAYLGVHRNTCRLKVVASKELQRLQGLHCEDQRVIEERLAVIWCQCQFIIDQQAVASFVVGAIFFVAVYPQWLAFWLPVLLLLSAAAVAAASPCFCFCCCSCCCSSCCFNRYMSYC